MAEGRRAKEAHFGKEGAGVGVGWLGAAGQSVLGMGS